jgi:signal transduction histidine kinase
MENTIMIVQKNRGLADILFIALTLVCVIVGNLAVAKTKTPDTPLEQAMEKIILLQSGQEVDFSAHLKKGLDGKLVTTDMKAHATKPLEPTAIIYTK